MRLRSARAWVAAACALATSVAGAGVAGATTYGPSTPHGADGWTGEDKRVHETRALLPEDRYAMAGGCYAVRAAGGGFVERAGDGFAATAGSAEAAEPFHFQATDLGSYLLFGSRSDFVAAG